MNADYIDMLKCLNKAGVDYILVGGWAVNMYGYIRATVDLDIWILADAANAKKVYAAVAEFGAPVSEMKPEEFAEYGMIFQIGVAPCRVDIISKISGVSYADAVTRAVPKTIDGIPVRLISLEDLIANKKASGRAKDLADVEILEGCRK
ncbi:MAG: nucleotidyltransferase [Kiritimatiellae bacterium]|nr:nucleotidyltransferase [Kiritimatiellia bacterium]